VIGYLRWDDEHSGSAGVGSVVTADSFRARDHSFGAREATIFSKRGPAAERVPDTRRPFFYFILAINRWGETQTALRRSDGSRRYQMLDLVLDSGSDRSAFSDPDFVRGEADRRLRQQVGDFFSHGRCLYQTSLHRSL